jgi:hypothetical protein
MDHAGSMGLGGQLVPFQCLLDSPPVVVVCLS